MRAPSANAWVKIHGGLTVFWMLLTIPAVTLWRDSVPFLVSISMCALVLGSIASWTAAKADCNSPTREDLRRSENQRSVLLRHVAALRRNGDGPAGR